MTSCIGPQCSRLRVVPIIGFDKNWSYVLLVDIRDPSRYA